MAKQANYADQTGIFDPAGFAWQVHLIGVGGIGSNVMLPLIKLGLMGDLHLWDRDEVEPHNIPAQLIYRPDDIGLSKVEAAKAFLEYMGAQCSVIAHDEFVTAETSLEGVVISGVDSMKARRAIWEAVKYNPQIPFFIDGRIGGESLHLLAFNPMDSDLAEWYEEEMLFDDADAAPLPCAARTVIHPPTVLSGLIVCQLTRFFRDMPLTREIYMQVREFQLLDMEKVAAGH